MVNYTSANKTVKCKYCDSQLEISTDDIVTQCPICSKQIAFFNYGTIGGTFH
jgi:primosomal protein N'